MRKIVVSKNEAGQKLLKLLAKYLNGAPASFLHKMLRKKNITLNGKKADGSELLKETGHLHSRLLSSRSQLRRLPSHTLRLTQQQ